MSSTTGESRPERKERTRRAILDAALELAEDSSLVALSLRQVAKQVGIVPTAFYRHFESIEDLGLALVEESFASLRELLRDVRAESGTDTATIDGSLAVLREHVAAQRAHYHFIVRERFAGPAAVRSAIERQIELVEHELATDLAHAPGTVEWAADDLRLLANLIVSVSIETAMALLRSHRAEHDRIIDRARQQLRMLLVGAAHWRSPG